jgi:uncharacterized protein
MLTLTIAIFCASVVGSFHCVGMCGPFVAIAVGGRTVQVRQKISSQLAYHLGRLTTYVVLGVAAGGVGSFMNIASGLAGFRPVAATLAGTFMILAGGIALGHAAGVRIPIGRVGPAFLTRWLQAGHRCSKHLGPTQRAGVIGLLTTLLPCGWLWMFAITAAGTARPDHGGLVMVAFWLGTLPLLIALGTGVQSVLGRFAPRLSLVTSALILVAGIYTVAGRESFDPASLVSPTHVATSADATPPCCRE